MKTKISFLASALALTVIGCGGGGGSSTSTEVKGTFIDSVVQNVSYSCSPSNISGSTNELGEYTCNVGDTVTFSLGGTPLGTVTASETPVTPVTLFPNNPEAATNVAQLLQTIDSDNDASNGITPDLNLIQNLPEVIDFESEEFDTDISNALGQELISEEQAQEHLNETLVQLGEEVIASSSSSSLSSLSSSSSEMSSSNSSSSMSSSSISSSSSSEVSSSSSSSSLAHWQEVGYHSPLPDNGVNWGIAIQDRRDPITIDEVDQTIYDLSESECNDKIGTKWSNNQCISQELYCWDLTQDAKLLEVYNIGGAGVNIESTFTCFWWSQDRHPEIALAAGCTDNGGYWSDKDYGEVAHHSDSGYGAYDVPYSGKCFDSVLHMNCYDEGKVYGTLLNNEEVCYNTQEEINLANQELLDTAGSYEALCRQNGGTWVIPPHPASPGCEYPNN